MTRSFFSRAQDILAQRRERREAEAANRKNEVYAKIPRLEEIDKELDATGVRLLCAVTEKKMSPEEASSLIMAQNRARGAEWSRLLKEAGYPGDYLTVLPLCGKCGDTGFIGDRLCGCVRQQLTEMALEDANISPSMAGASFGSFRLDYYSDQKDPETGISPRQTMSGILKTCVEFTDTFETNKINLLFYGSVGLGKTFLSSAIAGALAGRGVDVLYISANALFPILEDLHFGRVVNERSRYIAAHAEDAELLILDDLGAEFVTPFTSAELFRIINNRLMRDRKMVLSTNLSYENLSRVYSPRIVSRIIGYFETLAFCGEDIRRKKRFGTL